MSPLTSHPDLDLLEDSNTKKELLNSNMFWGSAGSVFAIHDEPDELGSLNYLHPINGTHGKHWFGFTNKSIEIPVKTEFLKYLISTVKH